MLQKLKINNTLLVNISSLGLVQMANYLIPIVIVPYVVRALRLEAYGTACYAQSIIFYLTLIVNYGFEYSATQEIAINKENKEKLGQIFWNVVHAKFILLLMTVAVLALLYFVMPQVHDDPSCFVIASLINIGYVLFPSWFFQGMEKMAKMSVFTFSVKFIGAVFTVILVHQPQDYKLYLLSLSAAQIAAGLAAFLYVVWSYHLDYVSSWNCMRSDSVKKGFPIFVNTAFVNSNMFAGIAIMGFFLDDTHVGVYSGAQKIIMAIMMISSQPIAVALFPRISRKFSESRTAGLEYLKKSLVYISAFSLLVSLLTFFAAPTMVGIMLGQEFGDSIPLLKYMAVLPFLVSLDTTMTVQGLYGMQLQRFAPVVGGVTCAASILLNLMLIPKMQELGIVVAWIICQCIDILLATLLILRYKNKE